MLSEYEIMRIADAVYQRIAGDDKLAKRIGKTMQKDRLLTAKQAAELLNTSVYTIRRRAGEYGGILQSNGRWLFKESKLKERLL